jgi:hypothetical protein
MKVERSRRTPPAHFCLEDRRAGRGPVVSRKPSAPAATEFPEGDPRRSQDGSGFLGRQLKSG